MSPVLLYPGSLADRAAVEAVESNRLMPTILDRESAQCHAAHARGPVRVFIKIDVGLERLGVLPGRAAVLARQVRALAHLELHGVYTHVDVPDGPRAGGVCRLADRALPRGLRRDRGRGPAHSRQDGGEQRGAALRPRRRFRRG